MSDLDDQQTHLWPLISCIHRVTKFGVFFANLATFRSALLFYEKTKVVQSNGNILGYFLLNQIQHFFFFAKISIFGGFYGFKSGLSDMFLAFEFSFDVDILAFLAWQLFCLLLGAFFLASGRPD